MPKLTDNVALRNPETGEVVTLSPGTELPKWADGLVGGHLLDDAPKGDSSSATRGRKGPADK